MSAMSFDAKRRVIKKLQPFILTVLIVVIDQVTKLLVVKNIAPNTIGPMFFGDFLRIIHVTNTGAAFSLASGATGWIRMLLLCIVPLAVLGLVLAIYWRNNDFTQLQRFAICGIVGGGVGNLIDRFFRPEGVVDFIDVKFFGILGFKRWPTFNVADSAVVVCGFLLLISFAIVVTKVQRQEQEKKNT